MFRDLTPLLLDPKYFNECIRQMLEKVKKRNSPGYGPIGRKTWRQSLRLPLFKRALLSFSPQKT